MVAGVAKPSRSTLKHHLFNAGIPKKLPRAIRALCAKDKKRFEFKPGRLLRGVCKIPISETFNGLVEMDFVGGGEGATSPRAQDTFSMYASITFRG